MVYHSLLRIPRLLQSTCLLCRCRIIRSQTGIDRYFGLCHYCQADLPFIYASCQHCSIPLYNEQSFCGECLSSPPYFDKAVCVLAYEQQVPRLINRFKIHHDNAVCRLLCDLMLAKIQGQANVDMLIATPMHWQRNLERGNNHSYLLAKSISRTLGLPLNRHALQRRTVTPVQKTLSAKQRKKNLNNAFYCPLPLNGLRIAVLDDVMTTGSTMNEMAKTLKAAGASEVQCWAIARTPKH